MEPVLLLRLTIEVPRIVCVWSTFEPLAMSAKNKDNTLYFMMSIKRESIPLACFLSSKSWYLHLLYITFPGNNGELPPAMDTNLDEISFVADLAQNIVYPMN